MSRFIPASGFAEIGEPGCELVDVGRSLTVLSGLKFSHGQLQLAVRIAGEIRESVEVVFDRQRGVGLPTVLLVLQKNGEFVGGNFIEAAENDADFRAEIPDFVTEIKTIFERWQLAEYLEKAR